MIIYKQWLTVKTKQEGTEHKPTKTRFLWDGWFLFGVIPLYIRRKNLDLPSV
jgi:hypothetical protein